MRLDSAKLQRNYLACASLVGGYMLAETLAYYQWGLIYFLNDLTALVLIIMIPASALMCFVSLRTRQYLYALSPIIFFSKFGFSFVFCPENIELPIQDWRMVIEYFLDGCYSLVSVILFIRFGRKGS